MKDSDVPAFTDKILDACKRATKEGYWEPPRKLGEFNNRCCPLLVSGAYLAKVSPISSNEVSGFTRGYDGRRVDDADERFYILGQGFRKIAETTGFNSNQG